MRVLLLVPPLACASCNPAPVAYEERKVVLNRIADECGLPRATFELLGDELHIKPDPDEAYPKIDCALREIKEIKIPFKLGFVGNEAYRGNSS